MSMIHLILEKEKEKETKIKSKHISKWEIVFRKIGLRKMLEWIMNVECHIFPKANRTKRNNNNKKINETNENLFLWRNSNTLI